jgi:predicted TIM-barrel fold metal-dependent hydrolase
MADYRVIDSDGHVLEPDGCGSEYLEPRYRDLAPRWVKDNQGRPRRLLAGQLQPYAPQYSQVPVEARPAGRFDPRARLVDMDSEGIDIAVLFPSAGLSYAAIPQLDVQVALCRAYNGWLRDYCRAAPERLVGVALVPQADIYETMVETRRAFGELGFRGVMLRPNPIGGRTLDHPAFEPWWSLLEELGVPALIHEGTSQNYDQAGLARYDNYLFRHVVSHPHEQQMAVLSLICGGVLERHPRLRVGFMEAGCGWLSYWLERLHEHLEVFGYSSAGLSLTPDGYFERQCYITAEADERTLPAIVSLLGDAKLLFASDYPHSDATFPGAVRALTDRDDLSEATKRAILSTNPAVFYGLR